MSRRLGFLFRLFGWAVRVDITAAERLALHFLGRLADRGEVGDA